MLIINALFVGFLYVICSMGGSLWAPFWGPGGSCGGPFGALWGHIVFMAGFGNDLTPILEPIWVPKGTPNRRKSEAGGLAEETQENVLNKYER